MTKDTFTPLGALAPGIVKRATKFHKKRQEVLVRLESMTDISDTDACLEVWYLHQIKRFKGTVAEMHRAAMTHVLADLEKRRRARLTPLIAHALATAQALNRDEQKEARTTVLRLIEALNGREKDRLT